MCDDVVGANLVFARSLGRITIRPDSVSGFRRGSPPWLPGVQGIFLSNARYLFPTYPTRTGVMIFCRSFSRSREKDVGLCPTG